MIFYATNQIYSELLESQKNHRNISITSNIIDLHKRMQKD